MFYFFYSLHCPLSGPDLTYISLLIIPCIIYHVTNKETLNKETLNLDISIFNSLLLVMYSTKFVVSTIYSASTLVNVKYLYLK